MKFPIIDISYVFDRYKNEETPSEEYLNDNRVLGIADEFFEAFHRCGFLYLKGHGFTKEECEWGMKTSREYFAQDDVTKRQVLLTSERKTFSGYVPYKRETFESHKPFDVKEAFDYHPSMEAGLKALLPGDFLTLFDDWFKRFTEITIVLFRLLGVAFKLPDIQYFERIHALIGTSKNASVIRSLFYPGLECEAEPGQMRIGEHTDFGSLTLLFQDQTGGLEARDPSGQLTPVTPSEGTIVVNAGNLLQRLTGDAIPATKHRVVLSNDHRLVRQSIAYFSKPDDDVIIEPIIGEKRYEPVNSGEYNQLYYGKLHDKNPRINLNIDD